MRRDYNLKPITYGVNHSGVGLVDLVEAPLDKYVGKDRGHGTGLIKL